MANESDRLKVRKITEQAMNRYSTTNPLPIPAILLFRLEELKQLQAKAPAAFKVVDQLDSLPSPPKLAPTAAPRGTGGVSVRRLWWVGGWLIACLGNNIAFVLTT